MEKCSRIFHSYVQIPGIVIAIENSKDGKTIHTSRWKLWGGFPPERSLSRYDDPTLKASPVKGHTYRICINHGRPAVPWNQINMLCGQIGRTMLLHNMFASSTMENPWKRCLCLRNKTDHQVFENSGIRFERKSFWRYTQYSSAMFPSSNLAVWRQIEHPSNHPSATVHMSTILISLSCLQ